MRAGSGESLAADAATAAAMMRELMTLGINKAVHTGPEEAVPVLAPTLSLCLDQRQDQEAIRLSEDPLHPSAAGQEHFREKCKLTRYSRRCLFFSSKPPRRLMRPRRVGLDDTLKIHLFCLLCHDTDGQSPFDCICTRR